MLRRSAESLRQAGAIERLDRAGATNWIRERRKVLRVTLTPVDPPGGQIKAKASTPNDAMSGFRDEASFTAPGPMTNLALESLPFWRRSGFLNAQAGQFERFDQPLSADLLVRLMIMTPSV
jgi:hypothetical protein